MGELRCNPMELSETGTAPHGVWRARSFEGRVREGQVSDASSAASREFWKTIRRNDQHGGPVNA
jgi:hypothetical protein